MQVREKVEKSRFIVFFQWFVAAEGRRVGSLKRRVSAGAEPSGEMRDENLHAVVARSTFLSQNVHLVLTTFRRWDVEKAHAVCGAKHISK